MLASCTQYEMILIVECIERESERDVHVPSNLWKSPKRSLGEKSTVWMTSLWGGGVWEGTKDWAKSGETSCGNSPTHPTSNTPVQFNAIQCNAMKITKQWTCNECNQSIAGTLLQSCYEQVPYNLSFGVLASWQGNLINAPQQRPAFCFENISRN